MNTLYQSILAVHASVGVAGLILFWIPVLLRKGSPKHKRIGNYFIWAMYVSGVTGLMMAMLLYIDPLATRDSLASLSTLDLNSLEQQLRERADFFLLLALLLLTSARQAKSVLEAKQDQRQLRHPLELLLPLSLIVAGIYLASLAGPRESTLFGAFAGLGIFIGSSCLFYRFKKVRRLEWVVEHLGGAFGAGIAAHTAFFVFGANRWIGDLFVGSWQLFPWLAPSALGVTAIVLAKRYYRKKYKLV